MTIKPIDQQKQTNVTESKPANDIAKAKNQQHETEVAEPTEDNDARVEKLFGLDRGIKNFLAPMNKVIHKNMLKDAKLKKFPKKIFVIRKPKPYTSYLNFTSSLQKVNLGEDIKFSYFFALMKWLLNSAILESCLHIFGIFINMN